MHLYNLYGMLYENVNLSALLKTSDIPKRLYCSQVLSGILPGIRQKAVQCQNLLNGNNSSVPVASFWAQAN